MGLKRYPPRYNSFIVLSKQFREDLKEIAKLAVVSRILTILFIILFSIVLENYDTSNIISNLHGSYKGRLDFLVRHALDGFSNWDAVYYTHIAEKGYTFEQFHAFFPLLPILMFILSRTLFLPLTSFLSVRSVLLLSGVLLSNVSFVAATVMLYLLGNLVLNDRKYAYGASFLFCFCPSSVFMSVIYTESLFAFLSFTGFVLFFLEMFWGAAFFFSLATSLRSNAILYCGFFIYEFCMVSIEICIKYKQNRIYALLKGCILTILTILRCLIVLIPFILFQYYGYSLYCKDITNRPYCSKFIPNIYDFVQKEYWNVGFLRYYTLSQAPNFLLALPVIITSIFGMYQYIIHDYISFFSLQMKSKYNRDKLSHSKAFTVKLSPFFSKDVSVFIYLWVFLLIFGSLFMHIQVLTRFFSSMPAFFWFCIHIVYNYKFWRGICFLYFGYYFFIGPVMFASFHPWT